MVIYALFLLNCRESLVRAFRKKTPLSVRRTWGGAKEGTESVHRNVTFFRDGFPKLIYYHEMTLRHVAMNWEIAILPKIATADWGSSGKGRQEMAGEENSKEEKPFSCAEIIAAKEACLVKVNINRNNKWCRWKNVCLQFTLLVLKAENISAYIFNISQQLYPCQ